MKRISISLVAIVILLSSAITSVAAEPPADMMIKMGGVQIRPDSDYVFIRARSGGVTGKTPFGFFAFNRKSETWETIGAAADFSRSVAFMNQTIDPETFFYSRQGYEVLELGSDSYTISWRDGRAVMQSGGAKGKKYESDPIPQEQPGNREYLIKYFQGTKIWFDMRVVSDSMLFSEGVGYFDIATKKFTIYKAADLGFKPGSSIITRMTGRGSDVWIGVSFCDVQTCLEHGGVSIIKYGEKTASVYTSDNSPLPIGAVLDIVPDGNTVWVASATGILEWNPEAGKARAFRLASDATICKETHLLNGPAHTETLAAIVSAGTKVTLVNPEDNGFRISTTNAPSAWVAADTISLQIK